MTYLRSIYTNRSDWFATVKKHGTILHGAHQTYRKRIVAEATVARNEVSDAEEHAVRSADVAERGRPVVASDVQTEDRSLFTKARGRKEDSTMLLQSRPLRFVDGVGTEVSSRVICAG